MAGRVRYTRKRKRRCPACAVRSLCRAARSAALAALLVAVLPLPVVARLVHEHGQQDSDYVGSGRRRHRRPARLLGRRPPGDRSLALPAEEAERASATGPARGRRRRAGRTTSVSASPARSTTTRSRPWSRSASGYGMLGTASRTRSNRTSRVAGTDRRDYDPAHPGALFSSARTRPGGVARGARGAARRKPSARIEELLIGVVNGAAGVVHPDRVVLARDLACQFAVSIVSSTPST